jgi:hypothetical protein
MFLVLENRVSSTSFPSSVNEVKLMNRLINNSFRYTSEVSGNSDEYFFTDQKLTQMSMEASEASLAKDWEKEDDAHWESFLK